MKRNDKILSKEFILSRLGRKSVHDLEKYLLGWDMASGTGLYNVYVESAARPLAYKLKVKPFGAVSTLFILATGDDSSAFDLAIDALGNDLEPAKSTLLYEPSFLADHLRKCLDRNAVWWGGKSISYVWAYLSGWNDGSPNEEDRELLSALDLRIRRTFDKFPAIYNATWRSSLLYECSGDEEIAFHKFMNHVEQHLC